MGGLSHYKNSHISMQTLEPVYLNLFEVIITPPPTVDKWDYVLETIKNIGGMVTDVIAASGVTQTYKNSTRRFASGHGSQTTVDINITYQVSVDDDLSLIAYKGLRKWTDLVWNPLNGKMMTKKNYVGGPMTVFLHNKEDEVLRQWIFPKIWPGSPLAEMALDYTAPDTIYETSMMFHADYWEDMTH